MNLELCDRCQGSGKVKERAVGCMKHQSRVSCRACNGKGTVEKPKQKPKRKNKSKVMDAEG
jgi:DnaJ-class molecular chaperone